MQSIMRRWIRDSAPKETDGAPDPRKRRRARKRKAPKAPDKGITAEKLSRMGLAVKSRPRRGK